MKKCVSELNDSEVSDNVRISLILDDENSISMDINVNDDVGNVCKQICEKYNISSKILAKLKNKIEQHLERVMLQRGTKEEKEFNIIQRLHYESVENKRKKEEFMEKLKKENSEKVLKGLTFTPVISSKSNKNYSKQFAKFEDRLYYDDMKMKNQKQISRILKNIENVEVCKQYLHKPRGKKSSKIKNDGRSDMKTEKNTNPPDEREINLEDNNLNFNINSLTNATVTNPNLLKNIQLYDTSNSIIILNNALKEKETLSVEKTEKPNTNSGNSFITPEEGLYNEMYKRFSFAKKKISDSTVVKNNVNNPGNTTYKERYLSQYNKDKDNKESVNMNNNTASVNNINNTTNIQSMNLINNSNISNNPRTRSKGHMNSMHVRIPSTVSIEGNKKGFMVRERSQTVDEKPMLVVNWKNLKKKETSFTSISNINAESPVNVNIVKENQHVMQSRHYPKNAEVTIGSKQDSRDFSLCPQTEDPERMKDKLKIMKQIDEYDKLRANTPKTTGKDRFSTFSPKHIKSKSMNSPNLNYIQDKNKKSINNVYSPTYNSDLPLYDRLYRSNENYKLEKEKHLEMVMKTTCPFQPKISDKSKKMVQSKQSKEGKDEVFNRLSYSNRNKLTSRSRIAMSAESSNRRISSSKVARLNNNSSRNNLTQQIPHLKKSSTLKFTSVDNINLQFSDNDYDSNEKDNYDSRVRSELRVRTKIKIREVKQENKLYNSIEKINKEQEKLKSSLQKKYTENIDKFKLNNLKQIFEVIYNNCRQVNDFAKMEKFGIPKNIKEKLILPTCYILKERNLEFNFQNFYLIANEIMNFIL